MEELPLTKQLFIDMYDWMKNEYAETTIRIRLPYLRKIFKKYEILNKETIAKIKRTFKHPTDRASIVMINRYCEENNIDFYLKIPKKKKYKKPAKPHTFSMDEINTIINATPYPYDLAIRCIYNVGAGLRISEVIKLQWNDIAWGRWFEDQENQGLVILRNTKGSDNRPNNIPPKLMKELYEYAKKKDILNEFRLPHGGYIFNFGGKGDVRKKYDWFRYHILKNINEKCQNRLGKKLKVHHLRHSRATYLFQEEDRSVEDIKNLLGHKSIETTMRYIEPDRRKTFYSMKNTKEI